MIIEGKLAIWMPGVLNLINKREETNIFLFRKKNSWKCQTTKLLAQMKFTCGVSVINQENPLTGRIVPGVCILTIVLNPFFC